jgi:hypothetical protein
MTYENDPNRRRTRDDTSYTGWIIGGVIAVAVILGIFMLTNRTDNTNTASNTPATAPSTTGSGATTPAPGPGKPASPVPAPANR